jgi:PAS domain S-box-containing protein
MIDEVPVIGKRPLDSVLLAGTLFAGIFALRFLVGTLGDAITFLYVIPVVLAGIALGRRAGLVAGAVAFALSTAWVLIDDAPITALGYFNRALVFLFVGGLAGHFATRMRALEAESARHFNLSLDMISTAGFDGCFKTVNPAFERVLGYREEDLVGQPFLEFVHPDDHEITEREAAALSDGRTTVQFQNRYFDKEGEVHWLEWTSVPLPDEHIIYGVARDITDRKQLEQELERLSQRDPLTGLFNRRRFDEELERQLAYARRYGSGGALLTLDLDRFKQINDELGHAAGDEALCAVAEVLRDNLRGSDTIGVVGVPARLEAVSKPSQAGLERRLTNIPP